MSKRVRFFIGHLAVSFVFILLLALLIFFVWFIPPLDKAAGILPIFAMLIVIDLFIGPLLGFLVYKEGKKSLKFDLSVVILLQVSLFLYGFHIISQARPTWIVFNSGLMDVVQAFEISTQNIEKAKPEFQKIPWFYPKFSAVKPLPNSENIIELQSGMSVVQKPERYISLDEAKIQLQSHAKPLNQLNVYNDKQLVEKTLAQYPQADAFIPLKANTLNMTVLLNKKNGQIIKIVDLRSLN